MRLRLPAVLGPLRDGFDGPLDVDVLIDEEPQVRLELPSFAAQLKPELGADVCAASTATQLSTHVSPDTAK